MAFVAVVLLAAAVAAFVLAPLFRRDALEEEQAAAHGEIADLFSQREMALAALRDLEDDRETGKVGDEDYRELRAKLSARAIEILKRLDQLQASLPARPIPAPPGRSPDPAGDP